MARLPVASRARRTAEGWIVATTDGAVPNPSPPEVGLRMARLWDAIRASAARGGAVITNPTAGPALHAATPAAAAHG
jgi:hypothetical protein